MNSSVQAFRSVADLVAPMSFVDFYQKFWTETPKYFSPSDRQKDKLDTLFQLEDFAEAVFNTQIRDTRLTLTSHTNDTGPHESCEERFLRSKLSWSTVPTRQELKTLCIHGATLSLKSIEGDLSKLREFRMNSLKNISSPLTIDAYYSLGQTTTSHDGLQTATSLFIVQVLGSETICLDAHSSELQKNPTPEKRTIDIQEGGILYLPRNSLFTRIQTTEESLQLHIAIRPNRSIEGLAWLLHQLKADPALHDTFPMILEDPSSHQAFLNSVDTTRLRALGILEDPEFVDKAFIYNFQTK